MVYLIYTTYVSVDFSHLEIFRSKVGKGDTSKVFSRLSIKTLYVIRLTKDVYFRLPKHSESLPHPKYS